jgi:hypothetical protein
MEELKTKAKSLGIKGVHLYKKEDALQAKIDEVESGSVVTEEKPVEVVEPKRKPAPKMTVANIMRDDRTLLVERLEAEDPDSKYIFQNSDITDAELAAKGLERTEHSLKNDILCRTDRQSYDEVQALKREAQYEAMQRIDGGKGIIDRVEERQRTPRGS